MNAELPLDDPLESLVGQVANAFLEEAERGGHPDVESYAHRYPPIAPVLREVLGALAALRPADAAAGAREPGRLGDFRLVREVGRGGMGVVYEAEQISLGRRVALKVLPFAAALDRRRLQRFKQEAQAVAHLHHTNIVPVFSVGQEQGVHYYAMQYIEGQTLATLIQELRQLAGREPPGRFTRSATAVPHAAGVSEATCPYLGPVEPPPADTAVQAAAASTRPSSADTDYFRRVATLGVQAAEALEHAHEHGVVHRDIKPGNLMVDAHGTLWVTDFGLAQFHTDANLTVTGDFLGTVRYMSPEQALGKRGLVDHRCDVYSLGATLYELLTLEPAVRGGGREEILRQIALVEPARPQRLNRAVPADLETIVLKALAKAPQDRYPTAQELADDLRRFLEYKPIAARRPSLLERAMKLARRHRRVVAAALGVAFLSLVALSMTTLLVWREMRQKQAALVQKDRALAGERRARGEAEESLAAAVSALQAFLDVAERESRRDVHWLRDHGQAMERALGAMEKLAGATGDRPFRRELAQAHLRMALIRSRQGQPAKADEAFARAVAYLDELLAETPTDPEIRARLAKAYADRAVLLTRAHLLPQADAAWARALGLQERLVQEFPADQEHRRTLADGLCGLGELREQMGNFQAAEQAHRRGVGILVEATGTHPGGRRSADCLDDSLVAQRKAYGDYLQHMGRPGEAEREFRAAIDTGEKRLQEQPLADLDRWQTFRKNLAAAHYQLAELCTNRGRLGEAAEQLGRAITLSTGLSVESPALPAYRHDLGVFHLERGRILETGGDPEGAGEALRQGLGWLEQVVAQCPDEAVYRRDLAVAFQRLGRLLQNRGRLAEAEQTLRHAVASQDRLAADFPGVASYRADAAVSRGNLALCLRQHGNLAEAERLLRQVDAAFAGLRAEHPRVPAYRCGQADTELELADLLKRMGRSVEAEQAYRRAVAGYGALAGEFPTALAYQRQAGCAFFQLAHLLEPVRPTEAEQIYLQARDAYAALVAASPAHPDGRERLALCHYNIGCLRRRGDRAAEAVASFCQAAALFTRLAAASPGRLDHSLRLAQALDELARTFLDLGRLDEAHEAVDQEAAALERTLPSAPEHAALGGLRARHQDLAAEVARRLERRTRAYGAAVLVGALAGQGAVPPALVLTPPPWLCPAAARPHPPASAIRRKTRMGPVSI